MKTFIYSITLLLLLNISFLAYTQKPSNIKPVKIIWIADGKKVSIERAEKGIPMPTRLSISVIFNNDDINRLDGQKLEFKWFRRGATRDYLTNSFIKQISNNSASRNAFTIETGRSNLKKGWWKVKIEAYMDRKLLSYQNKQVFWINLL